MLPNSSPIIRLPWPVVLYFPAPISGACSHDQHAHNVPSTSASRPRVICFASSTSGRNSSVACAISRVNSVMISETVPWETPKRSAITSSIIFCRLEQRYHDRFSQREALRPPSSLIPGIGQDIFDTRLKFIELFGIQSEGTMVTQRLLHRRKFWFAPSFYRCG